MSTATLSTFEREVRTLIRSRHGIGIALTGPQVKALLAAVNLPSGEAFLQKLRDNGKLRAIPAGVDMHPRYGIEAIVALCVELSGGAA